MRSHGAPLVLALALAVLPSGASASTVPDFDVELAWEYLEAQLEFGPRVPGTEEHAACADWMLGLLRERADEVVPHVFVFDDPYSDQNIQATNIRASFRPGVEPRIAIGAHWDTRPRADRDDPEVAHLPIPGANDGGSG